MKRLLSEREAAKLHCGLASPEEEWVPEVQGAVGPISFGVEAGFVPSSVVRGCMGSRCIHWDEVTVQRSFAGEVGSEDVNPCPDDSDWELEEYQDAQWWALRRGRCSLWSPR